MSIYRAAQAAARAAAGITRAATGKSKLYWIIIDAGAAAAWRAAQAERRTA